MKKTFSAFLLCIILLSFSSCALFSGPLDGIEPRSSEIVATADYTESTKAEETTDGFGSDGYSRAAGTVLSAPISSFIERFNSLSPIKISPRRVRPSKRDTLSLNLSGVYLTVHFTDANDYCEIVFLDRSSGGEDAFIIYNSLIKTVSPEIDEEKAYNIYMRVYYNNESNSFRTEANGVTTFRSDGETLIISRG